MVIKKIVAFVILFLFGYDDSLAKWYERKDDGLIVVLMSAIIAFVLVSIGFIHFFQT
jgi:hypothetical protein